MIKSLDEMSRKLPSDLNWFEIINMYIAEYKTQPNKTSEVKEQPIQLSKQVLSLYNQCLKRGFDFVVSAIGLIMTGWIIILAYITASNDTKKAGFLLKPELDEMENLSP